MNLYLISQTVNDGWDTFDSAIVAAESEDDARRIHPSRWCEFDESGRSFFLYSDGTRKIHDESSYSDWAIKIEDVSVKLIGEAEAWIERGVILASFNAG